jgi:PB1 domain
MDVRIKVRVAPDAPLKVLPQTPARYDELVALIRSKYPALKLCEEFVLTYIDEEGDTLEVTDDSELQIAYESAMSMMRTATGQQVMLTFNLDARMVGNQSLMNKLKETLRSEYLRASSCNPVEERIASLTQLQFSEMVRSMIV